MDENNVLFACLRIKIQELEANVTIRDATIESLRQQVTQYEGLLLDVSAKRKIQENVAAHLRISAINEARALRKDSSCLPSLPVCLEQYEYL